MKRIRLPREAYCEPHYWHLVLSTGEGKPHFGDAPLVDAAIKVLRNSADRYQMEIDVYCFMPDHVHLLVGNPAGTDIVAFVQHFKQQVGYHFRRRRGGRLWQRRFFDRALRCDESARETARYILENPVRANIVSTWEAYPFSGSFTWELREAIAASS